jgi:predicted enzyme related to lactoylglutathione lyase
MSNPIAHFEVTGKDGPRLQEFYSKLFDWNMELNEQLGYATVAPSDGSIGGGIGTAPGGGAGQVTFYVGVSDIEAALAKAEALGGSRVLGPAKIPDFDIELGQFADPEGHIIGVVRRTG